MASAYTLTILFHALVVVFVASECCLTVRQTHAAERFMPGLAHAFAHGARARAAALVSESAQARLYLVFAQVALALVMTQGGITAIAGFCGVLLGEGLVAQWGTLALTLVLVAAVEFPVSVYLNARIEARHRAHPFFKRDWLLTRLKEMAAGWVLAWPLLAAALLLCELAGPFWWLAAWLVTLTALLWRRFFSPAWAVYLLRNLTPLPIEGFARRIEPFFREAGLTLGRIDVAARPTGWTHGQVLVTGFGRRRNVLVFATAAKRLQADELEALIVHQIGHLRGRHAWLRFFVAALVSFIPFAFAGWGSAHAAFFDAFGLSRFITFDLGNANAGWVAAVACVVFPIVFFPLRPLFNTVAFAQQYAADLYAARRTGAGPLIRALAKLHRHPSSLLPPSRAYALFHYDRPNAAQRRERLRAWLVATGADPERPSIPVRHF